MKRIDVKFLLLQVVILVAVSMIADIILSVVKGEVNPIVGGLRTMPLLLFFGALVYGVLGNMFTGPIAKITIEKNSKSLAPVIKCGLGKPTIIILKRIK